jgi:RNA-directed DNA polymerase
VDEKDAGSQPILKAHWVRVQFALTVPTVLDRFIQQAVMQVLQRRWDRTFSEYSYGFRPGRSAHQAVAQAQQYIAADYSWVVDLDLEKFFDRVNHDKLMGQVAKRVEDKRLLKLIRAFLNAGVMENGLVSPSVEGTPQGGPLSPLLSNLVLDDELDTDELERRGHTLLCDTRMIATSTCVASGPVNG